MTGIVKFGPWGRSTHSEPLDAVKTTETPYSRSRTGYGSKEPTAYMVRFRNRWRRVYCAIYSNSGTTYICLGKECCVIDLDD